MSEESGDKTKWNNRYRAVSVDSSSNDSSSLSAIPPAAQVLRENCHLLPVSGTALDLACGLGANALFLAKQGLVAHAWDISDVAIERLLDASQSIPLQIATEVRDVVASPPTKNSFDVIVVSRFLERRLISSLIDAVKPGGLIFYQTFVIDKMPGIGPDNADYLLKPNELLEMFRSLTIRVYREEGLEGNIETGFRNEAMMVAQKTAPPK
ncbi:class I SAM-dependent methyltransferase [Kaarinaea lacus]